MVTLKQRRQDRSPVVLSASVRCACWPGFSPGRGAHYHRRDYGNLSHFYAVIENDLAYLLRQINQIGFMVVGIGIGTDLAIDGAIAHAFTHVLYKGLLFMSMGAVLFRTGKSADLILAVCTRRCLGLRDFASWGG